MQVSWPSTAVGVCFAICGIGCDRSNEAARPIPATAPTVSIAPATAPTTQAVSIEPANSMMMIDQKRVEFPAAQVRISKIDGQVSAALYSDDPKDALDDKYHGNGFYFELPLDVAETTFDSASSYHHAESGTRIDTPYGIFLDGHRTQLQPQDVKARLSPGVDGLMKIEIVGTFLLVNTQDDTAAVKIVPVAAWLMAQPISAKK